MALPRIAAQVAQMAVGDRLPPDVVREALARLVADPAFRASERNRRFLGFVVEETLAGRSARIKSYTIAVDVFGRGERFDPATDPIVRIEATRLRAALAAYYLGPGRGEPIRISIPKGGYVPEVQRVERAEAAGDPKPVPAHHPGQDASPRAVPARKWPAYPILVSLAGICLAALVAAALSRGSFLGPASAIRAIVIVEDAVPMGGGHAEATAARGLTQSLIMYLSQTTGVTVIAGGPTEMRAARRNDISSEGTPVFILSSSIRVDGRQVHAWWSLAKADSGEVVWSDASDRQLDGTSVISVEAEIASGIADRIGVGSVPAGTGAL